MSVIVHGSEGMDSTLIIVSLIQIILDPDCRTIRGFEALIEREWIKGGHPFASRCTHLAYGKSKATIAVPDSPTFLLFLDCVWQICNQFSRSFEFTDALLIFIFDNAYASEFGTFLCNSEKEKLENGVKSRTISLW
uniref:Myotubularin phosphatase domain-containing protein n=1 Tax=Romanomermis culicivorax TaxID=13658 RepID=A0A915JJ03_ROMCU